MRNNLRRLIFSCALLLCLCGFAGAETARDVTQECAFRFAYACSSSSYLRDRNNETMFECESLLEPVLHITTGETKLSAIYLEYGRKRLPFKVQVKEEDSWRTIARCEGNYAQEYVSFPPVHGEMRLLFETNGYAEKMGVSEIYCFSEGKIDPSIVHLWQPTAEKADLMVVVAHPDDEVLWLGGCIPYYAGERNMQVAVVYFTCSHPFREIELLNCLWHLGVRTYPLVGRFQDVKANSVEETYRKWDRDEVNAYMVDTLRTLRPEVVVTHGFDGEYGHAHHKTIAYALQRTVQLAAQQNEHSALPAWQVKKLYHHGGERPTTVMDWDQPLTAFQGRTGYEMACEGFLKHASQTRTWYTVAKRHKRWDSYVYSLTASTVGEDAIGGDLFENIPAECISTYYK